MKNILSIFVVSSLLAVGVYASEMQEPEESESDFYIVGKVIATMGADIDEESSRLEGKVGKGVGLDLGYRVAYGFAVEVDATYASNKVTEVLANGDREEFTGVYITNSIDIVYDYELTEKFGIFAKGGYEVELEKISDLDIDNTSYGFVYAAGAEYEVAESIALLAEYEVTTIDGPRGNSAFLGVMYNF